MIIAGSIVFFVFLGLAAVWIFRMWWAEINRWPGYRAAYRQELLKNEADSKINMSAQNSVMIAIINLTFGGLLWLLFGYLAVVGIFLAIVHALFV